MDRYIKESEIQEVIDKWQESLSPRTDLRDSVIFDTLESVNFHIDDLATADVVEVVHGEWSHLGGDEWCCTNCGEVICTEGSWEKPEKKFCHECGAKMDGKKV